MVCAHDEGDILTLAHYGIHCQLPLTCAPHTLQETLKALETNPQYTTTLVTSTLASVHSQTGEQLTPQEKCFLRLCCTELTYKEMATELNITERATDALRDKLFGKLKVVSRSGLMRYALKKNIATLM